MTLSLIAAMSLNRIIGNGKDIPWSIPGEQKIFQRFTLGHSVVMGRITYESIGKPLDGRLNIVVTGQSDYRAPGCKIAGNLNDAIRMGKDHSNEVFVIGGEGLFKEALPLADRIYLTTVNIHVDGDTFFPEFDEKNYSIIETHEVQGKIPYTFRLLEKKG